MSSDNAGRKASSGPESGRGPMIGSVVDVHTATQQVAGDRQDRSPVNLMYGYRSGGWWYADLRDFLRWSQWRR